MMEWFQSMQVTGYPVSRLIAPIPKVGDSLHHRFRPIDAHSLIEYGPNEDSTADALAYIYPPSQRVRTWDRSGAVFIEPYGLLAVANSVDLKGGIPEPPGNRSSKYVLDLLANGLPQNFPDLAQALVYANSEIF